MIAPERSRRKASDQGVCDFEVWISADRSQRAIMSRIQPIHDSLPGWASWPTPRDRCGVEEREECEFQRAEVGEQVTAGER